MKQYFTYDDPPIESPPERKSIGNQLEDDHEPMDLFTESPGNRQIEIADALLPNNSQNVITYHIEALEEINPLPELTKSLQLKEHTKKNPR